MGDSRFPVVLSAAQVDAIVHRETEAVHLVSMLVDTLKFETSRHAEFRSDTAQRAIDRAEAWLQEQQS